MPENNDNEIIFKNEDEFFATAKNITSVSDYLNVLRHIRKQNGEKEITYFFRGDAQIRPKEEENIPSIYRKKDNFIEREKEIYHDMISRCPQDFIHCNTALDHLVMMQHYAVPTRLLDLSENPLVALYFACCNYNKKPVETVECNCKKKIDNFKNGKVNIFQVKNIEIKHYNSDTAAMLANLAKAPTEFNICILKLNSVMNFIDRHDINETYKLPRDFHKKMSMPLFPFLEKAKKILSNEILDVKHIQSNTPAQKEVISQIEQRNLLFSKQIEIIEKALQPPFGFLQAHDSVKEIINSLRYITQIFRPQLEAQQSTFKRFIHSIKEEKPYFDPDLMVFKDLESVICVKPKQDNPHIIRQNGAFFLFGVKEDSESKKEGPPIPDQFNVKITGENVECIIPARFKEKILDELKSLSISEGYLFTDIDKVAKDVKTLYKNP